MNLRTLFFVGLSTVACCIHLEANAANADKQKWHAADGKIITGKLVDIVGPLLMIATDGSVRFVKIETLTDAELEQVREFVEHPEAADQIWGKSTRAVAEQTKNRLCMLKDGKLVEYDVRGLREPRFYLLYYSAGWCPPCHQFTPKLVTAYQKIKQRVGDQVEVLFVSNDENGSKQQRYATEFKMPWPAIRYLEVEDVRVVNRWAGNGIPCLVLVTRDGELVFHSYQGEEYLGPESVLEKLESLLPYLPESVDTPRPYYHRLAVARHLSKHRESDARLSPYFTGLSVEKFKKLKIADIEVQVDVDVNGRVTAVKYGDTVPTAIEYILREDIDKWRFLPKLVHGKPVAGSAKIPISFSKLKGKT